MARFQLWMLLYCSVSCPCWMSFMGFSSCFHFHQSCHCRFWIDWFLGYPEWCHNTCNRTAHLPNNPYFGCEAHTCMCCPIFISMSAPLASPPCDAKTMKHVGGKGINIVTASKLATSCLIFMSTVVFRSENVPSKSCQFVFRDFFPLFSQYLLKVVLEKQLAEGHPY